MTEPEGFRITRAETVERAVRIALRILPLDRNVLSTWERFRAQGWIWDWELVRLSDVWQPKVDRTKSRASRASWRSAPPVDIPLRGPYNQGVGTITPRRNETMTQAEAIQKKNDTLRQIANMGGGRAVARLLYSQEGAGLTYQDAINAGIDLFADAEETAAIQRQEREEVARVAEFKMRRDERIERVQVENVPAKVEAKMNTEPSEFDKINGHFTIKSADGSHRTVRIRTQPQDASFAPGEKILGLLTGADNVNSYTQIGFLKPDGRFVAWKRFRGSEGKPSQYERIGSFFARVLTGKQALPQGYEMNESRTCIRCGRLLTTPESVLRGLGPECASKGF